MTKKETLEELKKIYSKLNDLAEIYDNEADSEEIVRTERERAFSKGKAVGYTDSLCEIHHLIAELEK